MILETTCPHGAEGPSWNKNGLLVLTEMIQNMYGIILVQQHFLI